MVYQYNLVRFSWVIMFFTGSGLQWSNLCEPASIDDNFSMLQVFIMLIVDAIIYGLITWYVEAVFPGEFGVPLPFYFPIQVMN